MVERYAAVTAAQVTRDVLLPEPTTTGNVATHVRHIAVTIRELTSHRRSKSPSRTPFRARR
jgi:hypothetical protein